MPQLYQYSPDDVIVTAAGVDLSGYMDGTFLDVERNEAGFTTKTGSLGDVVRTKNLNRTAKMTLTLQDQAPSNDTLTGLAIADELTGDGTFSIQIKDTNGTMFIHSEEAWVEKIPKVQRGKESTGTQWVFTLAFAEILPGGNVL